MPNIAAMPLYTHVDRIERGLAAQGIGPTDPIPPEALYPLDQWHYHGTDAVRDAAIKLGLRSTSRVLDIGSGIGGPARFLAHTIGCHVTAIELQPGLNAMASDLTRRCGLADRVTHVCADALAYPLPDGAFDAAISFFAILHMTDRRGLFARLARAVRSGGGCHVEDLAMRTPFSPDDLHKLRTVVFGITVTSLANYAADMRAGGFTDVEATDMTDDWAPYAKARLDAWQANHEAYAASHGEGAYAAQEHFYRVIHELYKGGSLAGARLNARRP